MIGTERGESMVHTNTGPSERSPVLHAVAALRIVLATLLVCSVAYPGGILLAGRTLSPISSEGSLIRDERGRVIGSQLIAQAFSRPEYFWPRPSAVDFNATGAAGSNLSPASPKLRSRVEETLRGLVAAGQGLVSVDLVTASGSGLDPDISLSGATYQAERVARARGLTRDVVLDLIEAHARRPAGFLTRDVLVNVLQLNIALDRSR
jgi:K+-transporting ATPase ATPase C chain